MRRPYMYFDVGVKISVRQETRALSQEMGKFQDEYHSAGTVRGVLWAIFSGDGEL